METDFPAFFLHRPDAANALDENTARELHGAIKTAVKNKATGLIVASRHPRVFCAGGDIRAYARMKTKSQGVKTNRSIRAILQSFPAQPLFLVAAIEGDVIGGGCELALACDWIICGAHSRFAFRQVGQNLTTGWGGAQRLMKRVRPSAALDWLSSGRLISAQEALSQGLVDQVVPAGEALTAGNRWLAERPLDPVMISLQKRLVYKGGAGEEKIFDRLWFSKAHRSVLKSAQKFALRSRQDE